MQLPTTVPIANNGSGGAPIGICLEISKMINRTTTDESKIEGGGT